MKLLFSGVVADVAPVPAIEWATKAHTEYYIRLVDALKKRVLDRHTKKREQLVLVDVNCVEYSDLKERFQGITDDAVLSKQAEAFVKYINDKYIVGQGIDPSMFVFVVDGDVS